VELGGFEPPTSWVRFTATEPKIDPKSADMQALWEGLRSS